MSYNNNRPVALLDNNYHVNQNTFLDEAFQGEYSGTNLIYKGFARPGASVNSPVWQIAFLTYDGSSNILSIQWPRAVLPQSTAQTQTVGTVTTPWATFSGTLTPLPIVPGSVKITVGAVTFTDPLMNGTLTGSPNTNTGTISYDSGDIVLNFSPDLLTNTAVSAIFSVSSLGSASNDYQFIWSNRHSYTYQ